MSITKRPPILIAEDNDQDFEVIAASSVEPLIGLRSIHFVFISYSLLRS